jgi:hypothetical protein
MSRTPLLGAALFNVETNWAEVSTVFGTRVQTIGSIDVSGLEQAKLVPANTTQLRNEITPGVNGVFGGEFEITMMFTGHGSTTDGAITLNAVETLLGIFLGNVAAASAAGTTASGAGTVSALATTAANGYATGALVGPIGSIGDGRGGGQFSVVGSHAANSMALLVAIDAVLNAADKIRNPAVAYTTESPTASHAVTSTRWRFQSGNLQYDCRGCYPMGWTLVGIGPAGEPTITFRFGVSIFFETSNTFPNVTAVQTFPHAAASCGSLFMGAFGVTTRNATTKFDCRTFELNYELGIVPITGHGGLYANQVITGARRTRDNGTVEFVVDAPDATTAPDLVTKWSSNSPLHLCYTWGAEDSKAGALYSPYVVPDGPRPVQFDEGGINSMRFRGRLGADNTKATDLARSALRIASA